MDGKRHKADKFVVSRKKEWISFGRLLHTRSRVLATLPYLNRNKFSLTSSLFTKTTSINLRRPTTRNTVFVSFLCSLRFDGRPFSIFATVLPPSIHFLHLFVTTSHFLLSNDICNFNRAHLPFIFEAVTDFYQLRITNFDCNWIQHYLVAICGPVPIELSSHKNFSPPVLAFS